MGQDSEGKEAARIDCCGCVTTAEAADCHCWCHVPGILPPPQAAGDPKFHAMLAEMASMHAAKNADYGRSADYYANLRTAERVGIPAWKYAWLRLVEKTNRMETYCQKGTLACEGVRDTLLDLGTLAIITLILHDEWKATEAA